MEGAIVQVLKVSEFRIMRTFITNVEMNMYGNVDMIITGFQHHVSEVYLFSYQICSDSSECIMWSQPESGGV